jgi:hypothetical protein
LVQFLGLFRVPEGLLLKRKKPQPKLVYDLERLIEKTPPTS